MSRASRMVRGALGVVVLVALLIVVNGWWREYRQEGAAVEPPSEATQTPDAAPGTEGEAPPAAEEVPVERQAPQPPGREVVVLIDGLNFREEPSRRGELIRGLGRGTRLTHLQTADGWHKVRDADGIEGYVSANPQYTEVE